MQVKSHVLLCVAVCAASMLLLETGMSWGRLEDPGISEGDIKRAWDDFSRNSGRANLQGNYPFMECFQKAAIKHQVPLPLLLAVARGESNFDPKAKSNKECLGIMQIRWPGTAKDLGITQRSDLFEPCINIDAGARYLSQLLERYKGDPYLAVAGYNYGPNAVSPNNVPAGATWYAAYIHRHLRSILSGPFEKTGRVLILEFTFYKSAAGFMSYLENQVQGLPLEIFKSPKYTYNVYVTYKTLQEQNAYLKRLRQETGIKPLKEGRL